MADPLPNRSEVLPDERMYNPSEGDSWAPILRAVLSELSINSIVTGPDRTVFEPYDGQLYIPDTPEGTFSLGNGTTWDDLGQLITPETLATKFDKAGGTITGDVSVIGTVGANNIDAPLDGVRRQDFAQNTRTFDLVCGVSGAWWKIARISDDTQFQDSRVNVEIDGTGPYGTAAHQTLRCLFAARQNTVHMDYALEGDKDTETRAAVVTTRDPVDGHRYLYIKATNFLSAILVVRHTQRFGQFEFEQVSNDVSVTSAIIGDIVTDTSTDSPSYDVSGGDITAHGQLTSVGNATIGGTLSAGGPITENGNQVWHNGNFSPATKADKSDEYTTPSSIGTQKNNLSLTRAGGLLQSVGAIMPAAYSQPTIIHAPSAFDSPLAEWYVYAMNYSEHRNHLFYSNSIEGPYTDYGIVLEPFDATGNQAEGPSVMHVPERNEVWMYYHELLSGTEGSYNNAIQQTYLATAPTVSTATTTANGTSFTQYPSATNPEPILEARRNGRWDDTNLQYATMRRQGGQFYCIYRAVDREANSVPFGYATSSDGIHWHRAKYPVGGGLIHSDWTPNRKTRLARLFPSLIELNGELVALWTQDGTSETRALSWNQLQHAQPDSWVKFADVALGEGDSIDVPPYTYILSDEFMYRIDWRNY